MSKDETQNNKPFPGFKTDEDAERFVESGDLSTYDLSGFRPMNEVFEFRAKDKAVSLRLPAGLLDAVKEKAAHEGLSYQRFMRRALEEALQK